MLDRRKVMLGVICLSAVLTSSLALMADDRSKGDHQETRGGGESSPFTVGAWKLVCNDDACKHPLVDTEFRFINPTPFNVTLEYAFYENDGTFCGCDRDDFAPNQTTVYTASEEKTNTPTPFMTCKGNSGALKSIVFGNHLPGKIVIAGATQTGFQTHLFGNITTAGDGKTFYATTMAEAGMKAIELNPVTLGEVSAIHQACVNSLGPLK